MRSAVLLSWLALGCEVAYGQVAAYGRCGGIGYTGVTTCVKGWHCIYQNPYYYQCVAGAPTTTTTTTPSSVASTLSTKTTSSSISKATSTSSSTTTSSSKSTSISISTSSSTSISSSSSTSSSSSASSTATGSCTGTFTPITASAAFAALNPGWNLGNTLDATPTEGSWNNPPVVASTFAEIQAKGFQSVRIPVTWAYHFIDASPTWNINSTWMDRVETVVDEALAVGLYVVLNAHHDATIWADYTASGANITMIDEQFGRLWAQIGARFACKSSKLIFEPLNEPAGSDQSDADVLNNLSAIFLQEINEAGGYNPQRVVSLSGLGMDSIKTSQWFVRPSTYPNQPWGLQFHYYSPYDFLFSAWGKTIWGSDADKASLLNDFTLFNGNFTDVPAFIGEWSSSTANNEAAARWKYFDYFIRTANSFNYSTIIWDNGGDQFDRTTDTWYDPIDPDILFAAVARTSNSLADSTTDTGATSQNSSAYLFHKVGDPVVDQSVPYLLNGNTLTSVTNSAGTALTSAQYSMSATGSLTLSAAYLSTLYSSTSAAGIYETLTLAFSAGTPLTLTVVQYATPIIPTTSYVVDPSADLYIPVTYQGLPEVAAVTAINADGTLFIDTWTIYLGPLQQGRWTYGDWAWDSEHFIVYEAGLSLIKQGGQAVTLTVEFYPRSVGQNSVNITFTL